MLRKLLPVIGAGLVLLAACGGGGGSNDASQSDPQSEPPVADPSRVSLSGRVELPTGVTASDFVITTPGSSALIESDGRFAISTRRDGVTAIAAMIDGQSFGLLKILSDPDGVADSSLVIDLDSTAVALVFLSPYLLTTDPDYAAQILDDIEADRNLPALADAIQGAILSGEYLADRRLNELLNLTIDSVLSTLSNSSAQSLKVSQYGDRAIAMLKIPKLAKAHSRDARKAEKAVTEQIDSDYLTFSATLQDNSYFLAAESNKVALLGLFDLNAVDWYTEVAELDVTQFASLNELQSLTEDTLTPYRRVPEADSLVGHQITYAEGLFRSLDIIGRITDEIVESLFGSVFGPDGAKGVGVPADTDAVYILRSFSGGIDDSDEKDFVREALPNGTENNAVALLLNMVGASLDGLSIVLEVEFDQCTTAELIEWLDQYLLEKSANDGLLLSLDTFVDVAEGVTVSVAECLADEAAKRLLEATAKQLKVLPNRVGAPLKGGMIIERFRALFFSATPLESAIIIVGDPAFQNRQPPPIPSNVVASAVSTTAIEVTWNPGTEDEDPVEYEVRRTGPGDSEELTVVRTSDTSYVDSGLIEGEQYCYRILAYSLAGIPSDPSPEACASPQLTALTVELESIVDPSIAIPGWSGESFGHVRQAVLDNGRILFVGGETNVGPHDLFLRDTAGNVSLVVSGPGEPQLIALGGDSIFYVDQRNLYAVAGADPNAIVRPGDPWPDDSTQQVGDFQDLEANSGVLVFVSSWGVFVWDAGTLSTIADADDIPPRGSTPFWSSQFTGLAYNGALAVFRGYSAGIGAGLYSWGTNGLTELDRGEDYGDIALDGTTVYAERSLGNNVYDLVRYDGSSVDVLSDVAGQLVGFGDRVGALYASQGRVVFSRILDSGDTGGIYLFEEGEVVEIVGPNDELDGRIPQSLELAGFEGRTIVFIASWDPGNSDLYTATLSR